MQAQTDAIEFLCRHEDCVIDTAEEVTLRNENINNLKNNGLMILLSADARTIASRLSKKEGESIKELKYSEEKSLGAADYVVDTSNVHPEEICDMIMHYIELELR